MTAVARPRAGPCPGCAATAREPAFTGRDWYLGAASGTWQYLRCAGCGSVLGDPQASDDELAAAYDRSYGPFRDSRGVVERLGEPLALREAARLVTLGDPTALAVDVGCGSGAMIRRLRASGWRGPVRGVEPNAEVAGRVADRYGVPVDVSPVEALPDSARGAGLIVLRHVIEHLREPLAVLRTLREALVPGGLLYVATPDRRALAERAFGAYWHGYDSPRHLYAFTPDGLRGMARRAGFELVEERWDFAPQMWSASLHHRLRDSRFMRQAGPLSSLLNPLVGGPSVALGLLEWMLRRTTMYGLTARRPA